MNREVEKVIAGLDLKPLEPEGWKYRSVGRDERFSLHGEHRSVILGQTLFKIEFLFMLY